MNVCCLSTVLGLHNGKFQLTAALNQYFVFQAIFSYLLLTLYSVIISARYTLNFSKLQSSYHTCCVQVHNKNVATFILLITCAVYADLNNSFTITSEINFEVASDTLNTTRDVAVSQKTDFNTSIWKCNEQVYRTVLHWQIAIYRMSQNLECLSL